MDQPSAGLSEGDSVAFLDHPVFGDDLGSVAIVDRSGKKRILSTGWGASQGSPGPLPAKRSCSRRTDRRDVSRSLRRDPFGKAAHGGDGAGAHDAPGRLARRTGSLHPANTRAGFLGLLPGRDEGAGLLRSGLIHSPYTVRRGKDGGLHRGGGGAAGAGLLRLPAQAGRFAGRAARRGAGSGDLSGREMGPDLPPSSGARAGHAPADGSR